MITLRSSIPVVSGVFNIKDITNQTLIQNHAYAEAILFFFFGQKDRIQKMKKLIRKRAMVKVKSFDAGP